MEIVKQLKASHSSDQRHYANQVTLFQPSRTLWRTRVVTNPSPRLVLIYLEQNFHSRCRGSPSLRKGTNNPQRIPVYSCHGYPRHYGDCCFGSIIIPHWDESLRFAPSRQSRDPQIQKGIFICVNFNYSQIIRNIPKNYLRWRRLLIKITNILFHFFLQFFALCASFVTSDLYPFSSLALPVWYSLP